MRGLMSFGFAEQVEAADYDDFMVWRYGAMSEEHEAEMIAAGLEPEGHSFDMPDWLRIQLHYENVVAVLAMRFRYWYGSHACRIFGHNAEIDESASSAENPCVDWYCPRCGMGGRNWW